ncbi:hypothetical protein Bca4012_092566 [Brassica carinata]
MIGVSGGVVMGVPSSCRNVTTGTTPSRLNDVDPVGSDSRTETLTNGPTGTDRTVETTQMQGIPPIRTTI